MRGATCRLAVLVGGVGLLGLGCQDVYLADDIDLEWNWSPLTGASDALHTPYVVGAPVRIWARNALSDDEDGESGWTLESSDDGVLRIDSQSNGAASCVATGAGVAEIRVHDADGDRIYSGDVEVREPTRAELLAHGPLILHRGEEEALVDGPIRILAGGTATFLVHYYSGDTRLFGNGVLSSSSDSDLLSPRAETSFLFENREWLQLSAHGEGRFSAELLAAGVPLGAVEVEGATADAVERIELWGEDEASAAEEEWLAVLAQAFDAGEEPVYGVEYAWEVDGGEVAGHGDLYRYEYLAESPVELGATFDGLQAEALIHAGDGYVSSTNVIGCSVGGGAASVSPFAPIVGLALLALRRRRRVG